MIRAWRLIKAEHAEDAFAGEGAKRGGGRRNSKGVRVVYTSILHISSGFPQILLLRQTLDLGTMYTQLKM